jgi:hypothetical protein
MWNDLAEEIWLKILFLLSMEDLLRMRLVNNTFIMRIYDPSIWDNLLKEWICINENIISFSPRKFNLTSSYEQDIYIEIFREWLIFQKCIEGKKLVGISSHPYQERVLFCTPEGIDSFGIPVYISKSWKSVYDRLKGIEEIVNGVYNYEMRLDFEALYPSIMKIYLEATEEYTQAVEDAHWAVVSRSTLMANNTYIYQTSHVISPKVAKQKEFTSRRRQQVQQKQQQKRDKSHKNMKRSNFKIKEKRKTIMKSHKHN